MKLALTAAAALISLSIAGAATAAPSLSYAHQPSSDVSAEFIDAKFKFKKFGHSRGFKRGGFIGKKKYGHFGKGAFVKKGYGSKKFFFGKAFRK